MVRATLHRLMLATEGTAEDAGAERIALALARALKATLVIVLPLATNEELLEAAPEVALAKEVAAGATLRRITVDAQHDGLCVETVVRRGSSVGQEIVAAAASHDADLLVTRRVGRRGLLARLLVGEMVSQVAAQVGCPVLMTPAPAATLWHRHVLVPQVAESAGSYAIAEALAAAARIGVARRPGPLAQVIAGATAGDLVTIAVRKADFAAGRLGAQLESVIGAAPCPTLLVPVGTDVAGRA